jgi:high-affinity Fe2+/Pb2+ permease
VAGTLIVEGAMFIAGLAIYAGATRARDGIGRYGFWALVLVLAAAYVSSLFVPPPQGTAAMATGAIVFECLFVLFGMWVDRHRELRQVV